MKQQARIKRHSPARKNPSMLSKTFIEALSDDGRGIARVQGKIIFVEGALPGEQVSFRIIKRKKSFDEAVVESIDTPSPLRVSPPCIYFEKCGGCALQHLDAKHQLKIKEENVWQLLKRLGKVEPKIRLPSIQGSVWHYRHRARLHIEVNQHHVYLGFKAKQQDKVVDIVQCLILNPSLDAVLLPLNHLVKTLTSPERITEILMAEGKEGIALVLRCKQALSPQDKLKIQAFEKERIISVVCEDETEKQIDLTYPFQWQDFQMQFYPTDFTQVNVSAAENMLDAIIKHSNFTPQDRILDLFCGLGFFSLALSKYVSSILGVEGERKMVQRATLNAEQNDLSNVQFVYADLNEESQLKALAKRGSFTKVILDPPRAGAIKVISCMPMFQPEMIIYISCHPATFARDAHVLVYEQGYVLNQACVVDLFPQTAHVEIMAWFEKK